MLLDKLAQLNLDELSLNWIKSYLSCREQRVFANGTYSPFQTITEGVPQGSVLDPLFHVVYANDLVKIVKNCQVALYEDNTVLYIANKICRLYATRYKRPI